MSEHLKYNNIDGTQAGTVLEENLTVACSQGAVRLIEVQPAGKSKMSAKEFLKGRKVILKNVLK
jgi:methionyl-tRNA formyltransferase